MYFMCKLVHENMQIIPRMGQKKRVPIKATFSYYLVSQEIMQGIS